MRGRVLVAAAFLLLAAARPLLAQQTLVDAREMYATAAYDEALTLLDRLKAAGPPQQELREIEQYRVLCLLALKKQPEAEKAIEALVGIDPFYRPGEADAAPWVRANFSEVRRRLLPGTARQHYLDAKTLFAQKEYGKAAAQLNRVIAMLEDPDIGPIEKNQTLGDLRTLAEGFLELSQNALAAVEISRPPAPTVAAAPPAGEAAGAAAGGAVPAAANPMPAAAPRRIYTMTDPDVTPPTVVFQRIPPLPTDLRRFVPQQGRGVLDIVIDESGVVESAVVRESLQPAFDALMVEAARTWRYKPATRAGKPVKYRRFIEFRGPGI